MTNKAILFLVGVVLFALLGLAAYSATDTGQTLINGASITNTEGCGQICGKVCESCDSCDGNCEDCDMPCNDQGGRCGGHKGISGKCGGHGCGI